MIAEALIYKYPDLVWSVTGDDYDTLIMHEGEKPTLAEIESAHAELEALGGFAELNKPELTPEAEAIELLLEALHMANPENIQKKERILQEINNKYKRKEQK